MLKHLKKHCRKKPKILEGVSITEEEEEEEEDNVDQEENSWQSEDDNKNELNNETLTK